jgi:hypothetical protein
MAWGARKEGGDQLTAWETFKVSDGKIHAVEAFMRVLPVEIEEWRGVGMPWPLLSAVDKHNFFQRGVCG